MELRIENFEVRTRLRPAAMLFTVLAAAAAVAAADNTFLSTWKAPDAGPMNFAGRKVAALVIVSDDNLRMSAEEALAREISARGPVGVPANRFIPRFWCRALCPLGATFSSNTAP